MSSRCTARNCLTFAKACSVAATRPCMNARPCLRRFVFARRSLGPRCGASRAAQPEPLRAPAANQAASSTRTPTAPATTTGASDDRQADDGSTLDGGLLAGDGEPRVAERDRRVWRCPTPAIARRDADAFPRARGRDVAKLPRVRERPLDRRVERRELGARRRLAVEAARVGGELLQRSGREAGTGDPDRVDERVRTVRGGDGGRERRRARDVLPVGDAR